METAVGKKDRLENPLCMENDQILGNRRKAVYLRRTNPTSNVVCVKTVSKNVPLRQKYEITDTYLADLPYGIR
ncbi:hypothetical protein GCM10027299_01360 [Larkinella ripae]